jgi:uncharacterized protein YndB with AHSA1/START domain
MAKPKTSTGISDEAVRAKTGKGWSEWFAILDKAGAASMPHKDIATFLYEKQKIPGWWAQMVTVGYERERGLRQVHETPAGFQISVSKTMAARLAAVFAAWHEAKPRAQWLGRARITIRKVTPEKSIRLTFDADQSHVDVRFYSKGAAKSQVAVDHTKLASAADVARMKAFWSKALETLKTKLEG